MRTFVRTPILSLLVATAVAQNGAFGVEGLQLPWIERFETGGAETPLATARTAALVTLGWLRLADHPRARVALASCCAAADVDGGTGRAEPAWATAATYWYLRATHDADTARRHLPRLVASLARMGTDASTPSFVDETMLVHGMLCVAGIETFLDRESPGPVSPANGWSRRAIERWLEIERQSWQPGRGHFRPRLVAGAVTLPEPADPTVLWPAAAGMLVASGDHITRHLQTVVEQSFADRPHELSRRDPLPHAPALLLSAATQLAAPSLRATAWRRFTAASLPGGEPAIDVAANELDASLFAITGVRLATGTGVDEGWLRVRPWLPPGCDRVLVRGLRAEGVHFDMEIEDRTGEANGGIAAGSLRVRVTILAAAASTVRLVVQGPTVQFVTRIGAGDSFERFLPNEGER